MSIGLPNDHFQVLLYKLNLAAPTGSFDPLLGVTTIVTQSTTSPTTTIAGSSSYDSVRVWTGETPVTEPYFDLYVNRGGTIAKVRMNRWEGRLITLPAGSAIGFGTSDGRAIRVTRELIPTLSSSFPVSGTANIDKGGVPIWVPSAPHITLPSPHSSYEISSDGTERVIFISEYDGATWSPVRWLRVPVSGGIRVRATFAKIALASYDGASLSVNGPTGAVIGGTSITTHLALPSATGATWLITTDAELQTAIAGAVSGDVIIHNNPGVPIVVSVNITENSFTSNNNVNGKKGMEGIAIKGATDDYSLYTFTCSGAATGDWLISHSGSLNLAAFRSVTFDYTAGTGGSSFEVAAGRFNIENCRFTGATSDQFTFSGPSSLSIYLDCLRVLCDNGLDDGFNGAEGVGTYRCRFIDCISHTFGPAQSNQCFTTHSGLNTEIYGGYYYDANTNVIANDGSGAINRCFFVKTAKGPRLAGVSNSSIFGGDIEYTGISSLDCADYLVCSKIRDTIRESSNTNRTIFANQQAGTLIPGTNAYYPNVDTTTKYEYNLISGWPVAIRFDTGTGNVASMNNTLVANTTALAMTQALLNKTNYGNVCKTSNASLTTNAGAMLTLVSNYNVLDPAIGGTYVPGPNDITGVDADLDTLFFPTIGGNCDGTASATKVDWVGGSDYDGYPLEYSFTVRDRGGRTRPRNITNAVLAPDVW